MDCSKDIRGSINVSIQVAEKDGGRNEEMP